MRIAVLGCGPAGLVAAHTAIGLGHDVTVYSERAEPSKQFGCQYLHAPIPGYEGIRRVEVSYRLNGTPEDYRAKVYGPDWNGKVSPEDFIGEHEAWDIRETYHQLWWDVIMRRNTTIVLWKFRHGQVDRLLWADRVISTIPAPALCQVGHLFRSHAIYATGDRNPNGHSVSEVICDGTDMHDWYRKADVFGYQTTEWPAQVFDGTYGTPATAPKGSVRVIKPLSTECTCNPKIIRAGRYGEWAKGRLVHEIPELVRKALS